MDSQGTASDSSPAMNIVLDANVLISDYRLRGVSLRLLLLMVSKGNLKMTIPEVALREVVGKYTATLQDQQKKLESISRDLDRLDENYTEQLPEYDRVATVTEQKPTIFTILNKKCAKVSSRCG